MIVPFNPILLSEIFLSSATVLEDPKVAPRLLLFEDEELLTLVSEVPEVIIRLPSNVSVTEPEVPVVIAVDPVPASSNPALRVKLRFLVNPILPKSTVSYFVLKLTKDANSISLLSSRVKVIKSSVILPRLLEISKTSDTSNSNVLVNLVRSITNGVEELTTLVLQE